MAFWDRITSRGNVEDRRSALPVIGGGLGITGLALYLVINLLTGTPVDLGGVLGELNNQTRESSDPSQYDGEDEYEIFASAVLGTANDYWSGIFQEQNRRYVEPKLVLFRQATTSACGNAVSQVGPHYCTLDQTIYLDETFFDEMANQYGANIGDLGQAYVITHEVGHHIQNLLGTFGVTARELENNPGSANDLSIKQELQADCYAGLWARSLKGQGIFENNEIQEAVTAAEAVGDDRIQEKVTGYINPETWTHGSSEQRVFWFNRGYDNGDIDSCDTFTNQ